jgi:hypothetical protein
MLMENDSLGVLTALIWVVAALTGSWVSLTYFLLRACPENEHNWKQQSRCSFLWGVMGCLGAMGFATLAVSLPLPTAALVVMGALGLVGCFFTTVEFSLYRRKLWYGESPKEDPQERE